MREDRLVQALDLVLSAERAALLMGNYGQLQALADKKSALFSAIPTSMGDPEQLLRIADRIQRNQTLLIASIAGFKDAVRHIDEVRKARTDFTAYDSAGHREKVTDARPSIERKL